MKKKGEMSIEWRGDEEEDEIESEYEKKNINRTNRNLFAH